MFARYSTVRGDPNKIDAAIDYADGPARAAVEATAGNRGFAVVADRERGQLVGVSYWENAATMRASEASLADTRAAAAAALDGEVSIERFEAVIAFRHSIPPRGGLARIARFDLDPGRVDEMITLMREENVPRVKGADGLCSFQLLLDRETGAGAVVTAWESQQAAEAFWPTAQQLRANASNRAGAKFSQPDDYTMIRTTVRMD